MLDSDQQDHVGPLRERTGNRQHGSFMAAVASLARGQLLPDPPFDFETSSALARNIDHGQAALGLFARDHQLPVKYEVLIKAVGVDQPEVEARRIIDTVVQDKFLLMELLIGLVEEIEAQLNSEDQG